jgi:hypothetical protein
MDDLWRLIKDIDERLKALETLPGGAVTGTWTPAFAGSGMAGTFTYTTQIGAYTRLGRLVYAAGYLIISAISVAPVGTMRITGLPFTSEATYYHPVSFGQIFNFNYAASAIQLTGYVVPGTTRIDLEETFDNAPAVLAPAANFTNASCAMIFSAVYRVP